MLAVDVRARRGPLELAVRFELARGTLAIAGPNGAGKSTLLRLLLGALRPDAGRIALGGRTLHGDGVDLPPEERRLGYVPQHYALFPHLTVRQNVAFAGAARADELLRELELTPLADRLPDRLSGGERQRVALARALAAGPEALLLDEPMAALDASSRRSVRAYLRERLARLPMPALVVTHDPADAAALGDRILVLEAGRVVQEGTLAELTRAPATPFVAEFVSS